jgi:phosphatidylinositol-3-phosphatase
MALASGLVGLSCGAANAQAAVGPPPIRHVFVIVLENKEFAEWFGAGQMPYLTGTLVKQGALAPNYFGVGHSSADNYIAMISGQPPTADSKNDCPDPLQTVSATTDANGVAQSNGCLYPPSYSDIGDQLAGAGDTWRGYAESIPAPCSPLHDGPGNYARKHNPFVFFQSGIQSGHCAANDLPLTNLSTDLASTSTTANVNFIFPNECNDGHSDCTRSNPLAQVPEVGSESDAMAQADAFLKQYVPMITSSPAFQADGLLVVTWDEGYDPFGCCGEPAQDPDGSFPGGVAGSPGTGGGQVGAVAISRFITPGTVSSAQYKHYSLLASIEDLFGLPRLAEARLPGTTAFGSDVYSNPAG